MKLADKSDFGSSLFISMSMTNWLATKSTLRKLKGRKESRVIFVPKADAILETGSSTRALGMWLWGFVQGKSKALHNFGVVLVHRYICPRESCSTVAQLYLINLLCPIQ